MQLILNTDPNVGAGKMSIIQQDSLDEKFISNNLIEKVCSEIANITNGNDICVKNQEIEKSCENNIIIHDQITQIIENTTNNKIVNDKDLSSEVGKIYHEHSAENKENNELAPETNSNKMFDEAKNSNNTDLRDETSKEPDLEKLNKQDDKYVEKEKVTSKIAGNIEGQKNENCLQDNKLEELHEGTIALEDNVKNQDKCCVKENKLEEQQHETYSLDTELEGHNATFTLENEVAKMCDIESKVEELGKVSCEITNELEKQNLEEQQVKKKDNFDIVNKRSLQPESSSKDRAKDLAGVDLKTKDNTIVEKYRNNKLAKNILEQDAGLNDDCMINQLENFQSTHTESLEDVEMKSVEDKNASDDLNTKTQLQLKVELKKQTEEKVKECINKNAQVKITDCIDNQHKSNNEDIIFDNEGEIEFQDNKNEVQKLINDNKQLQAIESVKAEVIDIADEKNEECEAVMNIDVAARKLEDNSNVIEKDNTFKKLSEVEVDDQELTTVSESLNILFDLENTSPKEKHQKTDMQKVVEEKKTLTHICKLSNTLDILSDEDEDPPQETLKDIPVTDEKQCIDVDNDDEIMVIEEESTHKDSINKNKSITGQVNNEKQIEETCLRDNDEKSLEFPTDETDTVVTLETKPEENMVQRKPLLPLDFLKTCKKNLADMTRDELEEFCILKIVESVVDRSDLSEIKSHLKSMAQIIEEYRKKAIMLTKQNRDLQVVLKSVQEEQKKKSNLPITPLKITRSVGMQVLMTEKYGIRRKPAQGSISSQNSLGTNSTSSRTVKGQANQNSKLQKVQQPNLNSMSPIPVPRLVPAVNNSNLNNMKIQPSNSNTSPKSQVPTSNSNVPSQSVSNGLPTLTPAPKPEKRPLSRMQQPNSSVTVDLTDDEPPAKVLQRNITPPVRLVPPQNLLSPHRQPFGSNINSPRKVYIPISGSQSQGAGVRPAQAIMLKTISPQGQRLRCQSPAVSKSIVTPSTNTVRMQRIPSRHPAPLPDSMKQYQPPNWKALPPAPELKLSKVENGIVISWKIDGYLEDNCEEIASYQLYAYQETSSPPSTALWKKIGDVKALPLPMACTLTQFMAGYKYYFAVRAVDIRSRLGPFSLPGSILLLNKM